MNLDSHQIKVEVNIEEFNQLMLQIFTSAAFAALLLACLGWFLRTWFGEWLRTSIKNDYDKKLEKLKAELKLESEHYLANLKSELDRRTDMLKIASNSFSEVQRVTIVRKVEAVDTLWAGIVKFRKEFPGAVAFTDVLTNNEFKTLHSDIRLKEYSKEIIQYDLLRLINSGSEAVMLVRPHLGEYIWALYATYCTIITRSIYLLKDGAGKVDRAMWFSDENIKKLISSAFGDDRLADFEKLNSGR